MSDLEQDVALVRRALEGSGIEVGVCRDAVGISGLEHPEVFNWPETSWWAAMVELARRAELAPLRERFRQRRRRPPEGWPDLSGEQEEPLGERMLRAMRESLGLPEPPRPAPSDAAIPAPPGWPADVHGHALRPEAMTPEERLHLAIGLREAIKAAEGEGAGAWAAEKFIYQAAGIFGTCAWQDWMRALGQEVGDGE